MSHPVIPHIVPVPVPWTSRVLLPVALVLTGIVLGLATGHAPMVVGAGLLGLTATGLMLLRLDVAVMVFVVASLFEGYLSQVEPMATKLLSAVVVGSWVLMRCRRESVGMHRVPVVLAGIALWWVLLVSTLVNAPVGAAGILLRWAGFLAVMVVLVDVLLRRILRPEDLARTYVLAATAAAAVGLLAMSTAEDPRAAGPIADANDFAFYLLPALPLAMALRRPGPVPGRWDLAAAVVTVGMVATVSRGAMLGLGVMLVVALLSRQVRLRDLVGLAGVLLAAASVLAVWQRELVMDSLTQKTAIAGQNVSERFYLWDAAARMVLDRPLLGHGPGSFAAEHAWFASRLPVDTRNDLDVAHNTYLEVAAEAGFVGLAVFLVLLLVGLSGAWAAWRAGSRVGRIGAAVVAGLVGTSVAACFVTEQFFLPLWLLVALGGVLPRLADDGPRPRTVGAP
ncbi:O-antigen ligase [Nocardioides sp.]|uniref:O-antigen ligase family protein n=1 Tax=Nocardioides sp. TaxID=35761 RepID=UPI0026259429|nr:O-antigen ligase family protein [uncultured Nocardioides sp.]MCK5926678.1 O-antigen ligase family protein [Nocardioides sp.]